MKQRKDANPGRPGPSLIHSLYASPLSGAQIESLSLKRVDEEAPPHSYSPGEWRIVRRMVHATGDFTLVGSVRFSEDFIDAAVAALQGGRPLFADSNMIRSGLSLARLRAVYRGYGPEHLVCRVADEDVAREAAAEGLPRSLFAVRRAADILPGGIAVFGNAPVALLELNRLILEEKVRPAFVVALPVGFIHVTESKEELMSLDVPYVAVAGRRGGSPLAVSVIHALCALAEGKTDRETEQHKVSRNDGAGEAVILLAHGSRVPHAGEDMERLAARLKERSKGGIVETCSMSRLGPHFSEVFDRCIARGARKIILIPYFLHSGLHLVLDIPEMMQEKARQHPGVRVILGKHLGFDECLVELVRRRIEESRTLCDVRELTLKGRDSYPVPPGQNEFIELPPGQAAKYRKGDPHG
jgi:precorrin-8X/cobalt-precorrin-8 methylmutase